MSPVVLAGLLLTVAAGFLSGNCMLPLKFVRRWAWENTWFVFTLVSLLILPWLLAFLLVPHLLPVYRSLDAKQFAVPLLFGFGWGIAQILFGLSITRLGLALGYAIIVGLGACLGTAIPLFFTHSELVATWRGALVLIGVAVMLAGMAVSAVAGKEREAAGKRSDAAGPGNYPAAIAVAVVCGVMAPMLNFAFAFGQGIADQAVRLGTSPARAGYAVWPIALAGGLVPNLGYSIYLLNRNGTWNRFGALFPDVGFGSLMAVLWMGAFALYGVSSVYLGALGTSAGWALFQIFMIITATVSGVVTGEWRTAPPKVRGRMWAGLGLLSLATAVIASGNR